MRTSHPNHDRWTCSCVWAWRRHRYCRECRAQRWRREPLDCVSLSCQLPLLRQRRARAARRRRCEEGRVDVVTWVDYTTLAFTCGILRLKRSGTGSEGCLRYVPTLFYFIYSLPQQPHNPPRLTSSSPLQPQTCPHQPRRMRTPLPCRQTPRSRSARPDRATSASVLLKDFDTSQLPNELLLGCGQVFLCPKTPVVLRFLVRFNELRPRAVGG